MLSFRASTNANHFARSTERFFGELRIVDELGTAMREKIGVGTPRYQCRLPALGGDIGIIETD